MGECAWGAGDGALYFRGNSGALAGAKFGANFGALTGAKFGANFGVFVVKFFGDSAMSPSLSSGKFAGASTGGGALPLSVCSLIFDNK